MRMPRPRIQDCCIHVTHRCHGRAFLFEHELDRTRYRARLFQASRRFRTVRLLNYVVTRNHVHLLVWAPRMQDLSEMMKWLQGTFAQDYNRRLRREGAFWRGRFHATLVESGSHLSRCLLYLDLNMVRAGAVAHPAEWLCGGCRELLGLRKRYRAIDQARLFELLAVSDEADFRSWYSATLETECRRDPLRKEPHWSSAVAVGSPRWLRTLAHDPAEIAEYVRPVDAGEHDPDQPHVLAVPRSLQAKLMAWWTTKKM